MSRVSPYVEVLSPVALSVDDDALLEVLERYPVLATLHDAEVPLDRGTLGDRVRLSDSSIYRIVTGFQDEGLLEETDDGVRLTAFGRAVFRATADYRDDLATLNDLAPYLPHLPLDDGEFALDDLDGSSVTETTADTPMAPLLRLAEITETTDECRVLTNAVAPQSFDVGRERILEGEMEVHMVLGESAARTLIEREWYNTTLRDDIATDRLSLDVVEGPVPYQLAVMDDTVCLGSGDAQTVPDALLETTADPVRDWAMAEFRAFREDARPIDAVFEL